MFTLNHRLLTWAETIISRPPSPCASDCFPGGLIGIREQAVSEKSTQEHPKINPGTSKKQPRNVQKSAQEYPKINPGTSKTQCRSLQKSTQEPPKSNPGGSKKEPRNLQNSAQEAPKINTGTCSSLLRGSDNSQILHVLSRAMGSCRFTEALNCWRILWKSQSGIKQWPREGNLSHPMLEVPGLPVTAFPGFLGLLP